MLEKPIAPYVELLSNRACVWNKRNEKVSAVAAVRGDGEAKPKTNVFKRYNPIFAAASSSPSSSILIYI